VKAASVLVCVARCGEGVCKRERGQVNKEEAGGGGGGGGGRGGGERGGGWQGEGGTGPSKVHVGG